LGIIGFGGMGRGLARRDEKPGYEVTAVVDAYESARQAAQDEFGLQTFETVEDLLGADVVDAVYVATPNKFHATPTIACLKAGVHVICEKPIGKSAEEGEAMIAASEESGAKLTINLSFRATPEAVALKRIAEAGELGEVYFARTGWVRNRGIPGRGWFGDLELAGGGPLIDLGVHRIDLALWLMGHPKVVSVTGQTYSKLGKRLREKQGLDFTVEDLAAGFIRLENGATVEVTCSWALNSEWREDMYTYLYGTEAGAAHRHVGGTYNFEVVLWQERNGSFREEKLTRLPHSTNHVNSFVQAIREDGDVPVDPRDALNVQYVLDALYESARIGKEVRLDESS
jgi:predicted dehydrogenase